MALTPHIEDKNRKAELKRKEKEPDSFNSNPIVAASVNDRPKGFKLNKGLASQNRTSDKLKKNTNKLNKD